MVSNSEKKHQNNRLVCQLEQPSNDFSIDSNIQAGYVENETLQTRNNDLVKNNVSCNVW